MRSLLEAVGLVRPKNLDIALSRKAYKEGMAGRFENPYQRGTVEWKSWREGLRAAESDTAMCI